MPIIQVIVIIAVIGFLMWAINTYLPMADPYKKILNILVIILVAFWIISLILPLGGLWTSGPRIGH